MTRRSKHEALLHLALAIFCVMLLLVMFQIPPWFLAWVGRVIWAFLALAGFFLFVSAAWRIFTE